LVRDGQRNRRIELSPERSPAPCEDEDERDHAGFCAKMRRRGRWWKLVFNVRLAREKFYD
jgi:hypothetical protein